MNKIFVWFTIATVHFTLSLDSAQAHSPQSISSLAFMKNCEFSLRDKTIIAITSTAIVVSYYCIYTYNKRRSISRKKDELLRKNQLTEKGKEWVKCALEKTPPPSSDASLQPYNSPKPPQVSAPLELCAPLSPQFLRETHSRFFKTNQCNNMLTILYCDTGQNPRIWNMDTHSYDDCITDCSELPNLNTQLILYDSNHTNNALPSHFAGIITPTNSNEQNTNVAWSHSFFKGETTPLSYNLPRYHLFIAFKGLKDTAALMFVRKWLPFIVHRRFDHRRKRLPSIRANNETLDHDYYLCALAEAFLEMQETLELKKIPGTVSVQVALITPNTIAIASTESLQSPPESTPMISDNNSVRLRRGLGEGIDTCKPEILSIGIEPNIPQLAISFDNHNVIDIDINKARDALKHEG